MADITMCTQTLCPNAGHCYRVQAPPSNWQSMQTFEYTVGVQGVMCGDYMPMNRVTTSDSTAPNARRMGRPLMLSSVAVLFARYDSIYKALDCDVWDADRDARKWPGGCPVVAHPPCRAWGRLRHFATPRPDEKALALWAVEQVRKFGGVLEHPACSTLWPAAELPAPGKRDRWGGWTLPIHQHWWGHRAAKATLLYIVGCEPANVPPMPYRMDEPTHVVQSRKRTGCRPHITKAEREHTPPELASWLVELARRCSGHNANLSAD